MTNTTFFAALLFAAAVVLPGCDASDGSSRANVRLLNVSAGHDSLDMFIDDDDSGDRLILSGVTYESASDYERVDAGSFGVKLRRSGSAGNLATFSDQIGKGSHVTYVAFGETGRPFSALRIEEDEDAPVGGRVRVQVRHAAEAGAVDVYLTAPDASLSDQVPQFGSVGSAGATEFLQMDSGEYRLRVTGSGNTSDLRLDVSGVVLESRGVASIILTATRSGVLLNAVLLPQQGEPVAYRNTMSRVRAAHGLSTGVAMTARVSGVTLLSSATVGSLSQYSQVAAGSVPVSLTVDGTAIPVENQSLAGGADYTLLAWNDAEGERLTLLEDDNRMPLSSGMAKIRLLNGISGAGGLINLTIDFFPIAEGVPLGEASSYAETHSAVESIHLNVVSAATASNLWSRDEVTLDSGRVYTLLMTGRDSASINGVLRRDR